MLQVQIDRRVQALQIALQARPVDEPPLHSLRLALAAVAANEDVERLRRWTTVVAASPSALKVVLGAIQLKSQPAIAEFLASRLGVAGDDFIPVIVAGAIGGVVQAAHTQWFVHGGDFAETMAAAVDVLERDGPGREPSAWCADVGTHRVGDGGALEEAWVHVGEHPHDVAAREVGEVLLP